MAEFNKLSAMIANEGFVTKAPANKVQEIRDRISELEEILSGIEKRAEALN